MGKVEYLASLLKQHTAARRLRDGQVLHSQISCLGLHHHTFLGNCLIQLYGSFSMLEDLLAAFHSISKPNLHTWNILINLLGQIGRLDDAKKVFDAIPNPDIISWNSLIAAFVRNERPEVALHLFDAMQAKRMAPNDVTLVCALNACGHLQELKQGKHLHAAIVDAGYEDDAILSTAVLNMYNKCASFDEAKAVFACIPRTNAVSWNIMILAFIRNECHDEATALVNQMEVEGVSPTAITFVPFIDACTDIVEGYRIHHVIVDYGFNLTSGVEVALVSLYSKLGALLDVKCVLSNLAKRNVAAWNTAISTSSDVGHWQDALDIFQQLCRAGVKPNVVTYLCSLNACTQMRELKGARAIHIHIVYEDFLDDISVNTALVTTYGNCGNMHDVRHIFDKIHERTTICWTSMMGACIRNRCNSDVLDLFSRMCLSCTDHDSVTIGFAIDACTSLRDFEIGKKIHVTAISNSKLEYDPATGNALLKMYSTCGNVKDAKMVFDQMQDRSTITWTSMMVAFIQGDRSKEALQLFRRMQHEKVATDEVAFACALHACSSIVTLKEVEAALCDRGYSEDSMIRTALISMYGRCGSLLDVERVFESSRCRDVVMWTAVITAFAQNGYSEKALALFIAMQEEGIEPNEITFLCVLNACSHAGLIDIARCFFTMMLEVYGLCHTMDHYMCMVDLLGRAGQLDEAQALIQALSQEEVAGTWMCLLSACKIHSDTERGQHAASLCIKLDPRNDAPYVVLSNIYADAGRWNDVAFIRESMLLAPSNSSQTMGDYLTGALE